MDKHRFDRLLTPLQIRQVKIKNRMACLGHARLFGSDDGYVTELMIASYERLAAGGVGMIVVGQTTIDYPLGSALRRNVISDDTYIPGFSKLTKAIHKHNCPTFLQLSHTGPAQHFKEHNLQPVSSSALDDKEKPSPNLDLARELTIAEIEDIVVKFAKGAERARLAGFDGVEVHGAHSYLINSFLSRAWNQRQDAYGCQDFRSRARFGVEIIRAIKQRMGEDFIVGIRVNGQEWGLAKGITPEESQQFAKLFQEAGVDYISVSGYGYGPFKLAHYPEQIAYPEPAGEIAGLAKTIKKPGLLVPAAAGIKKAVSIPVIAVGRLGPELGEWLLQKEMVDIIGMVRRLIADPDLPNKIISGRLNDIVPCTACVECGSKAEKNEPIRCRVNATLGRELEYTIVPPKTKKKVVVVVGGGPAGMEAARVAALRGHEVTLYEKARRLGGLLPLAALIKGLEIEDLIALVAYFKVQLNKLGVRVVVGKEANIPLIEQIKPDVVVLAVGGKPAVPNLPGIDKRNVLTGADLHHRTKTFLRFLSPRLLRWLTKFWMPVGKRVIIMGGLIEGCELAEFMVKRGREVTIVETTHELGVGIPERNKGRLLSWLTSKGVVMFTDVSYDSVTDTGLIITTKEGQKQIVKADTILCALPSEPNSELYKTLEGKVPEVYLIGDCARPGKIIDAIDDGMRIARSI